ncbi:MAG: amidase [Candidatus Eisenbacteria bacterium]|nr:amidase [Candidatus Eisenbacteria bacterium]
MAFLSAAELGRRIARGEVSPVEVVGELLGRIERLDPGLGSYLLVTGARALDEARAAGTEIAARGARGPLHGVPVALKDLFDTAGVRTTAGSKILADRVPARDAAVVERLRAAGVVLLGKLAMHEFAYGTTTTSPHRGACRNPWDRARVPGGSSGGSGAALAAGLAHLSLGTDTGGSIRIPASACGVVGLKPTFGRVSRRGVIPLAWSLDHVGPMARTVEDAALLLNAIAGPDPEDPWCADVPAGDFTRDLERGARGLTIGVPERYFFEGLEPDVAAAVRAAVATLGQEGARRTAAEMPHVTEAHTALHAILAAEAGAYHAPWLRTRAEDYGEDVRRALELGHFIPAVEYVNARRMQQIVREEFVAALREADVLVAPSLPRTPPAIGEPMSREPGRAWNRLMTPANLTGLPAISLPCGFDRAGLPVGLQIIGRPFDEATVLRAARAFERATDWHERRPPGTG